MTFASVGAQAGFSLPLIGSLLGHRETATTARNAHLSDDPQRDAAGADLGMHRGGDGGPEHRRCGRQDGTDFGDVVADRVTGSLTNLPVYPGNRCNACNRPEKAIQISRLVNYPTISGREHVL